MFPRNALPNLRHRQHKGVYLEGWQFRTLVHCMIVHCSHIPLSNRHNLAFETSHFSLLIMELGVGALPDYILGVTRESIFYRNGSIKLFTKMLVSVYYIVF